MTKGVGPTTWRGTSRAGRWRLARRAVSALLAALIIGPSAPAQTANEYQVKAAFLFNFVKFIEWPAEAFSDDGAPLVIGVIGQDPFGGHLDQAISGKSVNGRQLLVRRFKWGEDVRACHVLFISASERKHLAQIIASLRGAAVLTVGDMDQFTQQGGGINFVTEASKLRFEINASVAEQARLKISSKLLALARAVRT
ncbi:MAG TPA: YfiR family protein [Blastocatellia bacterium]|nr:YfiR family protein [Blastocatellia bacterium]